MVIIRFIVKNINDLFICEILGTLLHLLGDRPIWFHSYGENEKAQFHMECLAGQVPRGGGVMG